MSDLIITKENYLEYVHAWNVAAKTFVEGLKKLCKVSPEFTHEPRMKVFNDGLLYESHYSYGKFTAQLRFVFFCLNEKKLRKYDVLIFDLRSFGIKIATQSQVSKMCGESPVWFDPERKLNNEIIKLVQEYINYKCQLTRKEKRCSE